MLIYNLGQAPLEGGTIDHSSMSWAITRIDERKYLMIQQQLDPNYIIGRLIIVPERNNITETPQFTDSWLVMTFINSRPMHLIPLSSYLALLILFTPNSDAVDAVPIIIDEGNLYEPITMNVLINNFFHNPAWTTTQPKFVDNNLQYLPFPIHGKTFFLLNTYDTHRNLYLFELDYNSIDPTNPIFVKTWTLIKSYPLSADYTTEIRIVPNLDITDDNYTKFAIFCLNNTDITSSDIFIYNIDGTLDQGIDCSTIPVYPGVTWSTPSIDISVIRLHDSRGHSFIEYTIGGAGWANTPVIYSNIDKNPFHRENLDEYHFMEFSTTATGVGKAGNLSLRVIRKINETLGILSQASMLDPLKNIVVQTDVIVEDRPWEHFFFKYAFDLYALFFRKYQSSDLIDSTNPRDYYIMFLDAQGS